MAGNMPRVVKLVAVVAFSAAIMVSIDKPYLRPIAASSSDASRQLPLSMLLTAFIV